MVAVAPDEDGGRRHTLAVLSEGDIVFARGDAELTNGFEVVAVGLPAAVLVPLAASDLDGTPLAEGLDRWIGTLSAASLVARWSSSRRARSCPILR